MVTQNCYNMQITAKLKHYFCAAKDLNKKSFFAIFHHVDCARTAHDCSSIKCNAMKRETRRACVKTRWVGTCWAVGGVKPVTHSLRT